MTTDHLQQRQRFWETLVDTKLRIYLLFLDHLMDKTVYDAQVNKSPVNKTG